MTTTDAKELSLLSIRDGQVEFDEAQDAALTSLGVHHATPADKRMFFHQIQRTGLDPFLRQIYMLARKTYNPDTKSWEWKQTFQTGIDGFRLVVQRKARAEGKQVKHLPVRYWDDQGKEYDAWVKSTPPAMIRYTLQLGDDAPVSWDARFEEYVQLVDEYYDADVKDGDRVIHKKGEKTGKKVPTSMWAKRPTAQLEKCAEAGAARRIATQDLGGIYLYEEMPPDVTGRGGPIVDVEPSGVADQPVSVSAQQEWFDKLAACTTPAEVNDVWIDCKKAGMRTVAFDKAARARGAELKPKDSDDAGTADAAENGAETDPEQAAEAPESVGSESDTPGDQASEASQNVRETPEEDDPWVEESTGQPACGAPNAGGYPTEHCRSAKGHPGDHVPGAIRKSVFDGPDE